VSGLTAARALLTGTANAALVARLHRFFIAQGEAYRDELRNLQTAADSPLVCSWLLYGGVAGQKWAAAEFKRLVKEGVLEDDPLLPLFKLPAADVAAHFSAGAWRYEYGLTPRSAARFVEEYTRATGNLLDIPHVFGKAARAVGNALYRRLHAPDPFRAVYRALQSKDVGYQTAATIDLEDLRTAGAAVYEVIAKPQLAQKKLGSSKAAQQIMWASFIPYIILAVEQPGATKDINKDSKQPPRETDKLLAFQAYSDPINVSNAYFHPKGSRYVDPAGTKWDGLVVSMLDLVRGAWRGKKISKANAVKILTRAKQWLGKNKLGGSLFHLLIVAWKKGDWKAVAEQIPLGSDVYAPFQAFTRGNPLPKSK